MSKVTFLHRFHCIFGYVHPAEIPISLHIRAVWSEFLFGAFWIANESMFLRVDNEDSDQTDLRFRWMHMSEGTLAHIAAQLHYENTPIQIYRKFHLQKLKIFR